MRRVGRHVGLTAAGTALVVGALLLSGAYHLNLPIAREVVRDVLSNFVSGEIRGSLEIGAITEMSANRVVARNVKLLDPQGRCVVAGNQVTVTLIPEALLEGTLHFTSGVVEGGHVQLIPGRNGDPTFVETFDPAHPTPSGAEPLVAVVDGMVLRHMTLEGSLFGLDGIRVEELEAHGRMEVRDSVRIAIHQANGQMVAPFPFSGRVDKLAGTIDTDLRKGVRLWARGETERDEGPGDTLRVRITYGEPEGAPAEDAEATEVGHLEIFARGLPAQTQLLRDFGYAWAGPLDGEFAGYFRLHGAPTQLAMAAWGTTAGGELRIDGNFGAETTELTGSTPGLDLDRILRNVPPLRVGGEATLSIDARDQEAPPRVHVEAHPFIYDHYRVPAFVASGEVGENEVRIEELHAVDAGGEVHGEGVIGFDGSANLTVRARLPQFSLEPNIRRLVPDARGGLRANVAIVLHPEGEFQVDGRLSLGSFRYGPLEARSLVISGTVSGQAARPRMNLRIAGTGISVFDYPMGTADLSLRGGPREYLTAGQFVAEGHRSFDFGARAMLEGNNLVIDADQLRYAVGPKVYRGSARRVVYVPDTSLSAQRIILADGAERLEAWGTYRFSGDEEIEVLLQDFDLAVLRSLIGPEAPPIAGKADTYFVLRGDVEHPQIEMRGALRNGAIPGLAGITASYAIDYRDGETTLEGEIDLGDRGSMTIGGTAYLDAAATVPLELLLDSNVEVRLNGLSLNLIDSLGFEVDLGATGTVTGLVKLEGPLFSPTLDTRLIIPELRFPGWSPLQVETNFQYETGALVGRLESHDDHGELVEVEGSLVLDLVNLVREPEQALASLESLPWRAAVRVAPRLLADLPTQWQRIVPEELRPFHVGLSGTLAGGGFATRGDVHAVAEYRGRLGDDFCGQTEAPRFMADARLDDGITHLTVRGFLGADQRITLEGAMPTPVDAWLAAAAIPSLPPARATLLFENAPAESLPYLCRHLSGALTASVEVESLFTDHPTGRVELHSPAISMSGTEPIRADMTASITSELATLEGTAGWWSGQRAAIAARIPVRWGGLEAMLPEFGEEEMEIDVDLESAPIGPILAWIPQVVDVAGVATGRVQARGALRDLSYEGEVRVEEGYMEVAGLGQQLTDLGGEVIFHGDWAELRRMTAHDGNGSLTFDGRLDFEGYRPTEAQIVLRSSAFPVRVEGSTLATLTGEADVEIQIGLEAADVDMDVRRLEVRLPDESSRSTQALDPHPDIVVLGEAGARGDQEIPYAVRGRVRASRPFWVRRSDFSVQVAAALDAVWADPELRVSGNIDLRQGFFEVLGKRFIIERGAMSFDGSPSLNPEVSMEASHQIRAPANATVTASASGTLRQPEIEFTSDHPDCNDRASIIGMLVSGRCTSQSSAGGSGDELAAQEQAGAFFQGLFLGLSSILVRGTLDRVFDTITIESGEGLGSARLRLGRSFDEFIPRFLRGVVQGVRVEGAAETGGSTASGETGNRRSTSEFMLELQFPHDLVWRNMISPSSGWSSDFTWEP